MNGRFRLKEVVVDWVALERSQGQGLPSYRVTVMTRLKAYCMILHQLIGILA